MPEPHRIAFAELAAASNVVPLRAGSRVEERESLPPSRRDDDVRDAREEDPRPPSESEVRAAVLGLRGAHAKSPGVVWKYACQLPRSVFLAALDEVQQAEADGCSRRPPGLLVYRLRVELEERSALALADVAGTATERFRYGEDSPSAQLRDDPERWIQTVSPRLPAGDVDSYLNRHVPDDLERRRLRLLADELRGTAT